MSAARKHDPSDPSPMMPASACATNDDRLVFIERTVRDIHVALVGNDLGQKGVIPRQQEAEEKFAEHIVEDNRRFNKIEFTIKWASGAVAGLFAAIKFWEYLKK